MKLNRKHDILLIILSFSFICSSCALNLKNSLEIRTNGFITENCYQAILEIEPDDSAMGLVAKRESAFLRAKNAQLSDLAMENLANYCFNSQLKAGIIEKNKKAADHAVYKKALLNKIKGFAGAGKITFVYYDEKNYMIIGYRMFKMGFKKKLDDIINPPANLKSENPVPTTRS
jgi:hypothetical protein